MDEGRLELRAGAKRASCPLCREEIADASDAPSCPGCSTAYHSPCLRELGGCSTLGCAQRGWKPDSPAADLIERVDEALRRADAERAAERVAARERRQRERTAQARGAPRPARRSGLSLAFLLVLVALLVPTSLCFGTAAITAIAQQHIALTQYVEVPARIEGYALQLGVSVEPTVRFSFEVDGASRHSDRLTPGQALRLPRAQAEAKLAELRERWPVGTRTTAWASPWRPRDSYLLRVKRFLPYGVLLVPFAGLSFLLGALVRRARRGRALALACQGLLVVGGLAAFAHYAWLPGAFWSGSLGYLAALLLGTFGFPLLITRIEQASAEAQPR